MTDAALLSTEVIAQPFGSFNATMTIPDDTELIVAVISTFADDSNEDFILAVDGYKFDQQYQATDGSNGDTISRGIAIYTLNTAPGRSPAAKGVPLEITVDRPGIGIVEAVAYYCTGEFYATASQTVGNDYTGNYMYMGYNNAIAVGGMCVDGQTPRLDYGLEVLTMAGASFAQADTGFVAGVMILRWSWDNPANNFAAAAIVGQTRLVPEAVDSTTVPLSVTVTTLANGHIGDLVNSISDQSLPLALQVSTHADGHVTTPGPVQVGGKCLYLAKALLDHVLGRTPYTPPDTLWVALSTDRFVPAATGDNLSEVIGDGYARAALANDAITWPAADDTAGKAAVPDIAFPQPIGDWGQIRSFYLLDAEASGHALYGANFDTPYSITAANVTPTIPATTLIVTES